MDHQMTQKGNILVETQTKAFINILKQGSQIQSDSRAT